MDNMEMVVAKTVGGNMIEMTRGQAIAAGLVIIAVVAAVGYAGYHYGKKHSDVADRLEAVEA